MTRLLLVLALFGSPVLAGPDAGRDGDRDGVPDSQDWCLGTAADARTGPDGCAVGDRDACRGAGCSAPAVTAPVPIEKPVPTRVVPTRTDSDHDGVPNDDDQCPGTARDLPVDTHGCALIEKVVLGGINFDSGSAVLKPEAGDLLRSVAVAMMVYTELQIEVRGYTDSLGDAARNRSLSERRARAVRDFLIGEGVDPASLTVKGLGPAEPADSNATAAGRANNRRVAFKVVRQK